MRSACVQLTESPNHSPGTPSLSVVLDCPSEMSKTGELSVTVKVTYDGVVSDDGTAESAHARPILLHNLNLHFDCQPPCGNGPKTMY